MVSAYPTLVQFHIKKSRGPNILGQTSLNSDMDRKTCDNPNLEVADVRSFHLLNMSIVVGLILIP